MQGCTIVARLKLFGVFRFERLDGWSANISSKRSRAMLAMLALSQNGERTRSWLQSMLWSDRSADQASASLRRELSNLRKILNQNEQPLLVTDHQTVRLDITRLDIDTNNGSRSGQEELLEGLDIKGAEGFEDWLRIERGKYTDKQSTPQTPAKANLVDTDQYDAFLDKPAIAVLRFSCQPSTLENEIVADGLAEDFVDRLSRMRWLPVISRNTSFSVGADEKDPRELGKAVGARYLLGGRANFANGQNSVRLTLDDAAEGRTLWTSTVDLGAQPEELGFIDLTTEVASVLGIRIDHEEQVRALGKEKASLTVTELIWRGRWHLNRLSDRGNEQAKACFLEALKQEPNMREARIQLIWLRLRELWLERGSEQDIREVRREAQRTILADSEDARGHMFAGIAEIFLRQPLRAEGLLRRAIELNPCLVMAHAQLGSTLYLSGELSEAEESLLNALRLSPNDNDLFYIRGEMAMVHLFANNPQSALEEAEAALAMRAGYWIAHLAKTVALIDLNDMEAAGHSLAEFKAEQPAFGLNHIDWLPYLDPSFGEKLKIGLNQAGF